jgi:hypothetical protein
MMNPAIESAIKIHTKRADIIRARLDDMSNDAKCAEKFLAESAIFRDVIYAKLTWDAKRKRIVSKNGPFIELPVTERIQLAPMLPMLIAQCFIEVEKTIGLKKE